MIAPSGKGKSRIIATAAVLICKWHPQAKVRVLVPNESLYRRDTSDFSDLFEVTSTSERITYTIRLEGAL